MYFHVREDILDSRGTLYQINVEQRMYDPGWGREIAHHEIAVKTIPQPAVPISVGASFDVVRSRLGQPRIVKKAASQ